VLAENARPVELTNSLPRYSKASVAGGDGESRTLGDEPEEKRTGGKGSQRRRNLKRKEKGIGPAGPAQKEKLLRRHLER